MDNMKKTMLGFLVVILLTPSVSLGATNADFEAQKVALLKQVIVLLQTQIKQLQQQIALRNGAVLGVSTSTVTSTAPTKPIVKKRGGGGGGGGSRGGSVSLSLDMVGSENSFTITSNQTLTPTQFSLTLLNFPADTDTPDSLVIRASLSNGGTSDISLLKQSTQSIYNGTPATLPSGVSYTGNFVVLIPEEVAARNIVYSVTYTGNSTLRTVTLENEGYAILNILSGTSEPDTSVYLHDAGVTDKNIYFARIQNTGYVSADIESLTLDTGLEPQQTLSNVVETASIAIANENSLTAFQSATRYPGVIGSDSITFSNLPTSVTGQSTAYVFLILGYSATSSLLYPGDIKVVTTLNSEDIDANHTNTTNEQVVGVTGSVSATTTPYTTGLTVERGSTSANVFDDDKVEFNVEVELETLSEGFMYLKNNYGNIEESVEFHIEDSHGNILAERYVLESNLYKEESDSPIIDGSDSLRLEVIASPHEAGDYKLIVDAIHYTGNPDGQSNIKTITPSEEISTEAVTITPVEQVEELRLITDGSAPFEITAETYGANDQMARFSFEFTVEAVNDNFYIENRVQRNASAVTRGFAYEVTGPDGANIQTVASINANTNEDASGNFEFASGHQITIHVDVELRTDTTGQYRVELSEINYSPLSNTLSGLKTIVPESTVLRSSYIAVMADTNITPDTPVDENPIATSTLPSDTYIEINESSSNPESTTIAVEEDTRSDEFTLLVVDVEPEGDNVIVERIVVRFDTPGALTENVVRSASLVIGGQTVDGDPIPDLMESDESAWFEFDTSALGPLEEDIHVQVEISADFNQQLGNFSNYQTIRAAIESDETSEWQVSAEEELHDEAFVGSVVGNYLTLLSAGLVIDPDNVETATDTQGENDTIGVFEITMELTAFEGDFYFTDNAVIGADNTTDGFAFEIDGGEADISISVNSTADEDSSGVFTVDEGDTEEVTVTVYVQPAQAGTYRVRLTEFNYTKNPNGITATEQFIMPDPTDFRTPYMTIQGNQ